MKKAALTAIGLAIVAAVVVGSGIIPIEASSGHWAITTRLLDFVKVRSVTTHAAGIEAPSLDVPALVARGAAHYDGGCRSCHGSPEMPPPAVPARMTPHPPALGAQVGRWSPAQLFYIVKHGIKFTGMPAWPAAGRDDEVWAVVAFVRTLPGMTAAGYARAVAGHVLQPADAAAAGDADGGSRASASPAADLVGLRCARCHGPAGEGREPGEFPRLAGQRAEFLQLALRAYRSGTRHSGIMAPIAAALTEAQIDDVAAHFASLPRRGATSDGAEPAVRARGAAIASAGLPDQDTPACLECHGPATPIRNLAYPSLAGQPREYLALQLRLFVERRRGGSPYAGIMEKVAAGLSSSQIAEVAAYFSAQPP